MRIAALIVLALGLQGCATVQKTNDAAVLKVTGTAEPGYKAVIQFLGACPVVLTHWPEGVVHIERWDGSKWISSDYSSEIVAPSNCDDLK